MNKRASIGWLAHRTPESNVRRQLAPLVRQWFKAGRQAAEPERTADELHQFRLATKRLRYTLELFRPLYGPGLKVRIELLREIQDVLGTANDYRVTAEGLNSRVRREPALQPVKAKLESRAAHFRDEFRQMWRQKLALPAIEVRWVNYVRRNTRPPQTPPSSTQ